MTFIVEGVLKHAHTNVTQALIPAEIAHGMELDAQGVRSTLYIAADFSRAWQILNAGSEAELHAILATFPLHPFLDYTITALAPRQA